MAVEEMMEPETLELLSASAHMRAAGSGWDEVGGVLKRPVCELREMCYENPAAWSGLLGEELRWRVEEAACDAINTLHKLFSDENAWVAKDAAKGLLVHFRWQAIEPPRRQEEPGRGEGGVASHDGPPGGPESRQNYSTVEGQKTSLGEENSPAAGRTAEASLKSINELEKLLEDQKPETRLRAAQSILVQFRWWWRQTHPRPRAQRGFTRGPKRPERGGDGIFTEEELQRQAEVRERDRRTLSVDRLMIFENGSDRPGGGSPRVEFFPKGDWFIKWWKADEAAEKYIQEMLKPPAEKPCPIVAWRFRDGKAIYWPQGDTDNWPPLTRDYAPPVSSGPEPEVSGPPARAGPEDN